MASLAASLASLASLLAVLVAAVLVCEADRMSEMNRLIGSLVEQKQADPSPSYSPVYVPNNNPGYNPNNPGYIPANNPGYNPNPSNNPNSRPARDSPPRYTAMHPSVVSTPSGCVSGTHVTRRHQLMISGSGTGVESGYWAFTGIPYAAPPVGPLRFKNPVRTGLPTVACEAHHGSCQTCLKQQHTRCVQKAGACWNWADIGQEDCLHLNVYVPGKAVDPVRRLPVMVYIHGGGFMYGSGAENGPDFFMERNNVILVTFNYRLGAFGFLNLDTDAVPGNMGLKDQQAVLEWVRDNIAAFGGDKDRVTLFGNSAGAASAHFHYLVESSQGLFSRLILQSGTALAGFAYNELHLHYARMLAKELKKPAETTAEMAKAFMDASADDIRFATDQMLKNPTNELLALGYPPFGPSPERRISRKQKAFLTTDPEHLVLKDLNKDVLPTIVGVTDTEGLFAFAFARFHEDASKVNVYRHHPQLLIPANAVPSELVGRELGLHSDMEAKRRANLLQFGKELKDFYHLEMPSPSNDFISMLGDIFLVYPIHRLVNMTLSHNNQHNIPFHQYVFKEDGDYNWGKACLKIKAPGATHTDEVGYLMNVSMPASMSFKQSLYSGSPSSNTLKNLVHLWTAFANGEDLTKHDWPEARGSCDTAEFVAFHNGQVHAGGKGLGGKGMALWERIYHKLRSDFVVRPNMMAMSGR